MNYQSLIINIIGYREQDIEKQTLTLQNFILNDIYVE